MPGNEILVGFRGINVQRIQSVLDISMEQIKPSKIQINTYIFPNKH